MTIVHPYDDDRIMAGQGTATLELIEDGGALDLLLVPVGGGGLIAGAATAATALCPGCRVVGWSPRSATTPAARSPPGSGCASRSAARSPTASSSTSRGSARSRWSA